VCGWWSGQRRPRRRRVVPPSAGRAPVSSGWTKAMISSGLGCLRPGVELGLVGGKGEREGKRELCRRRVERRGLLGRPSPSGKEENDFLLF
jgi:hypothetical protein